MLKDSVVVENKAVRAAELFATLKRRILQWEYPPGYRFTEEELSREFSVSRSPVRETLRMLEENGLVDKVPYRGCTVKQPDWNAISELYDVRLILETAAVEMLARVGMDKDEHQRLIQVWQSLAQTDPHAEIDSAALAEQDRAFHEALVWGTQNRTLYDMLVSINERLHFIRMTDITTIERLQETCRQHLHLLGCIAASDVQAAKDAMQANVEGAREHVKAAVKEVLVKAYMTKYER